MAATTLSQAPTTPIGAEMASSEAFDKKPVVIGLCGIPEAGTTTLMKRLELQLGPENFLFYEGPELISSAVDGGLAAFEKLDEEERRVVRERAITSVAKRCSTQNRAAVVADHYMYWPLGEAERDSVPTASDFRVYTHMIYLWYVPPVRDRPEQRRGDEHCRGLLIPDVYYWEWQQTEIDQLRRLCRRHRVLFLAVPRQSDPLSFTLKLVRHFERSSASCNLALAIAKVEAALIGQEPAETVLVVDANKTLAEKHADSMFWEDVNSSGRPMFGTSPLDHSEAAFWQVTLMYEEATSEARFEALCEKLASAITMHPEFITLFQLLRGHGHVRVVVLTCGIRRVWQLVLDKAGFGDSIKVIGGGRIVDGIVVTPEVKAQIVLRLRKQFGLYVWAFGDSPRDLPMLEAADRSVVVSGDEWKRSFSMEKALHKAVDARGFRSHQVLLPPRGTPRLLTTMLSLLAFSDADFVEAVVRRRSIEAAAKIPKSAPTGDCTVIHATNTGAAKLLMSRTRDASVTGVALRKAHEDVGKYLALRFVTEVIGVENFNVPHVQGHQTAGSRLAHESQTTIMALMRGGEPMALGVNEVFPRAMFVHASGPEDVKVHHLENQKNLILVDSVVNSGNSIMDFLRHVTRLKQDLANIVVVAGVVQEEAVADGHALRTLMEQHEVKIVALRVSSNKFTGTKATDTGNRLFNTTHLA